jgi:hypothetical protein
MSSSKNSDPIKGDRSLISIECSGLTEPQLTLVARELARHTWVLLSQYPGAKPLSLSALKLPGPAGSEPPRIWEILSR